MVVLIGFQYAGKSTLGAGLAQVRGCAFIDTDRLIEEAYQAVHHQPQHVREIFRQHGEAYFRLLEKEVIQRLPNKVGVIATGGGSVLDPMNVCILRGHGPLVYLRAGVDLLYTRAQEKRGSRFSTRSAFEACYAERSSLYAGIADSTIDVEDKTLDDLVLLIQQGVHYGQ